MSHHGLVYSQSLGSIVNRRSDCMLSQSHTASTTSKTLDPLSFNSSAMSPSSGCSQVHFVLSSSSSLACNRFEDSSS